jgi:FlaA1/EpsC-like NDP-sugar epimerase
MTNMEHVVDMPLEGANVVILGGTGSLGQRLFHRILSGEMGQPATLTVLSRDEAKQHYMRLGLLQLATATDEVIYRESTKQVRFVIGDVRQYYDLRKAVDAADVIFHAAALKQVPTCEYFGSAAVDTNVMGAIHLTRAVLESVRSEKVIVGISTDKACKPVNVMGMTKALQERILVQANLDCPWARFVNVRYGNVMASRGSAIPLFMDLVRRKTSIPITDWRMTRFLMTLNQSVDLIFAAVRRANRGETYLPVVPSARVVDIARAVAEDEHYPMHETGMRPGEKIHEILVSEEERAHTVMRGENLVILPILPELHVHSEIDQELPFGGEYTSGEGMLDYEKLSDLLLRNGLTARSAPPEGELSA